MVLDREVDGHHGNSAESEKRDLTGLTRIESLCFSVDSIAMRFHFTKAKSNRAKCIYKSLMVITIRNRWCGDPLQNLQHMQDLCLLVTWGCLGNVYTADIFTETYTGTCDG